MWFNLFSFLLIFVSFGFLHFYSILLFYLVVLITGVGEFLFLYFLYFFTFFKKGFVFFTLIRLHPHHHFLPDKFGRHSLGTVAIVPLALCQSQNVLDSHLITPALSKD